MIDNKRAVLGGYMQNINKKILASKHFNSGV